MATSAKDVSVLTREGHWPTATCSILQCTCLIPGHTWSYLLHTCSYVSICGHTWSYLFNTWQYQITPAHTWSYQFHTLSCRSSYLPRTWSYQIVPAHTWSYLFNTARTFLIPVHTYHIPGHMRSILLIPVISVQYS